MKLEYLMLQDVLGLFIDALGMYLTQDKEQEIYDGVTSKTVYLGFLNF